MKVAVLAAFGCFVLLTIPNGRYFETPSAEALYPGDRFLPDKVGQWRPLSVYSDETSYRLTKQERDTYMKKLQKIMDVFRNNKLLNPPMGVEVRPNIGIVWGYEGKAGKMTPLPYLPVKGHFHIGVHEYIDSPSLKKTWLAAEGPAQIGHVNDLGHFFAENLSHFFGTGLLCENCLPWQFRRKEGNIYAAPKYGGERQGFPVYNGLIVIKDNPNPLWLPLSREEYLRALLRQEAGPHAWGRAPQLQAELDSLSPEGRESRAYVGNIPESDPRHRVSGMCDPADPGARPVVRINPDFFDKSLPRTAFQLITVEEEFESEEQFSRFAATQGSMRSVGDVADITLIKLRQTTDLKKLADILDGPRK